MSVLNAGVNPSGLAITMNGRYLLVANNNNYGLPDQDNVSVFDLKYKQPFKIISDKSFNQPYTITIDNEGEVAYVCNAGSPANVGEKGVISVVSLNDFKVVSLIESDQLDGPSGMIIIKDHGYVLNYGANGGVKSGNGKSITVINLIKKQVIGSIPIPLAPAAITSRGKYIAVASYIDGKRGTGLVTLLKVDRAIFKVKKTYKGFFGPFDVKFSSDASKLLITNFGSNNFSPFGRSLVIQSVKDENEKVEIDVGVQPSCLAVLNDHTIVVSCYNTLYSDPVNYNGLTAGQGTLVYLDLNNNKIIKTIKVAKSPANIILSPDKSYSYLSCYTGGVVEVIKN